jgi:hypothetical protein
MKKFLLIACVGALVAFSASAYSPPENISLQVSETVKYDAPASDFTVSYDYTINTVDISIDVAIIDNAPVPVALVSNLNIVAPVDGTFGIAKSYSYLLKPPLLYAGKYGNWYNKSTTFKSPYSIRYLNQNKRC